MSLPDEVAMELVRLAGEWEKAGKDDLAHHALDVLDRMGEDAAYVKPCPFCGEVEKVEDTATNGTPRMTCKQCGKSWNPAEARNDGRPGPTH